MIDLSVMALFYFSNGIMLYLLSADEASAAVCVGTRAR